MQIVRVIVAGLFTMLIGSAAWATDCDGFTDVDSGASYCTAVVYLKDHGITLGCTGTTYCPAAFVTRAQMALFLQRMGQSDPTNVLGDHTDAIVGGTSNTANGGQSAVAGGFNNSASGFASTVTGGLRNSSSGYGAVTVGGANNVATGTFSFAAGYNAVADQDGCAVLSLWNSTHGIGCLGASGIFRVGGEHGLSIDYHTERADGGGTRYVGIGDLNTDQTITAWNGAYLSDAGVWTNVSDRAVKTDFTVIDQQTVLEKLLAMPIAQWRYKSETDQRHIGPVAQDFYAAFHLGDDDRHIATIDEGGVALAAIQGLNAKLEADQLIIAQQAHELAQQSHELAEIKAQLAAMAAAH